MCSEAAISLKEVSKVFETYKKPSHRLVQFFLKEKQLYEEFVALQNISLEIFSGETVGIVGKNGSGKSTLLQIIAGTLTASSGHVSTKGRISAILELGAGFNPEFTGDENARLNAAIIGMDREEVQMRMPEILKFSELGDFIHKPVKTYSSGMYVRLAFSVAINMRPDVLIIDEALAVGDSGFQRKCFRKLTELREKGVTILFVTHATDSVLAHCDRAVFMQNGRIQNLGVPKIVVNQYLESLFDKQDMADQPLTVGLTPEIDKGRLNLKPEIDGCLYRAGYNNTEYRWGNQDARIIDYMILDQNEKEVGLVCPAGSTVKIVLCVYFQEPHHSLIYGVTVKTVEGVAVFGSNTELLNTRVVDASKGDTVRVEFEMNLMLIPGEYFFSIGIVSKENPPEELVLDRRYDLFRIYIEGDPVAFGQALLPFSVTNIKQINSAK